MRPNLDSLAEEIQQHLEAEHFVVFRSQSRATDDNATVYWDTATEADFRKFLECALQLGVRLVHFHARTFQAEHREEAQELMEDCHLSRDEKRELMRRISELSIYEGFTCAVELSFDFDRKVYLYEMQTDWYEEWQDILDELEMSGGEDAGEGGNFGGFYSNN